MRRKPKLIAKFFIKIKQITTGNSCRNQIRFVIILYHKIHSRNLQLQSRRHFFVGCGIIQSQCHIIRSVFIEKYRCIYRCLKHWFLVVLSAQADDLRLKKTTEKQKENYYFTREYIHCFKNYIM